MDVEERHCSLLFLVRREPFDDLRTTSAGGCSASAFDVSSFLGWKATSGDASKGREETDEDSWTERRFDREVCFEGASLGVARGLLGSLVDVTREENLGLKVEEEEGEEEARSGLEEAENVLSLEDFFGLEEEEEEGRGGGEAEDLGLEEENERGGLEVEDLGLDEDKEEGGGLEEEEAAEVCLRWEEAANEEGGSPEGLW